MEDKKIKIREMFQVLSSERKNNVRSILSEKFNITVDSAKMNWVYAGKIPEQNIDEVLEIIRAELKKQSDNILELIDAI
jgi:hypothetical protein